MSDIHPIITGYIDGLKTSIDRLGLDREGNELAKGYRIALDDVADYIDEVQAGLVEERIVDEAIYNRNKEATK
ncbi:hypothetical protein ACTXM3_11870 [Glutamicibacter arilaitensis]|uniref:hypothetical protein n=1 Tax=Glutamicibacter arilaitensis TaxID=256701 RepID=UPI003FCF9BF5